MTRAASNIRPSRMWTSDLCLCHLAWKIIAHQKASNLAYAEMNTQISLKRSALSHHSTPSILSNNSFHRRYPIGHTFSTFHQEFY